MRKETETHYAIRVEYAEAPTQHYLSVSGVAVTAENAHILLRRFDNPGTTATLVERYHTETTTDWVPSELKPNQYYALGRKGFVLGYAYGNKADAHESLALRLRKFGEEGLEVVELD